MNETNFPAAYEALTGNAPFPWQEALFARFAAGDPPPSCNLPTGLGKTSVIPIWLIALAASPTNVPRRLVYVVNRRTVVDQATSVVEHIRERIFNPDHPDLRDHVHALCGIADRLRQLTAIVTEPLAVSTLRGELADNEEWKSDPARPAIIVGTIDMIGSKLLFSGYGDGPYHRAHHAGLIGQDTLIVHDEAHLTPAFGRLLRWIADEQRKSGEPRPIHVMELSATTREGSNQPQGLTDRDESDQRVQQRLDAKKRLLIRSTGDGDENGDLVGVSLQHELTSSKVLIYVRSPQDAVRIVEQLGGKLGGGAHDRVALLTGTIRGYERDRLVKANPVYGALLDHESRVERTVYLVSTSAGEVGIDLDADHMVCDLATLDSMIQRLGRVNRRGTRDATIAVIIPSPPEPKNKGEAKEKDAEEEKDPLAKRAAASLNVSIKAAKAWLKSEFLAGRLVETIEALRELPERDGVHDASPRAMRNLMDGLCEERKEAAWSPQPPAPVLTDILLDAWSLTSVSTEMAGRPEVASYLHGLTDELPETHVAWRKEVTLLDEARTDEATLRNWFRACRIEARERLRDSTHRVRRTLEALLILQRWVRTPIARKWLVSQGF